MPEPGRELVHGTAVAVAGRAVLIRGASGSGKSDLALRCLAVTAGPFAEVQPLLVADDQVLAEAHNGRVLVNAPETIRGLIEVRGVGPCTVSCVERAVLALVADIVSRDAVERLPEPLAPARIAGLPVPRCTIFPLESSAPLKLLLMLRAASGGPAPL